MKCPFISIDSMHYPECKGDYRKRELIAHLQNQHPTDRMLAWIMVEMIAAEEGETIPKAKIREKIKELDKPINGLGKYDKHWSDYDMATNANRAILSHLKQLLE